MAHYHDLPEFLRTPAAGRQVPALVLNVGRMVLHHGCVGIIRSLGRMGVPVYAVVEDRFTPAAVSRYLSGGILWDTRHLDPQRFLDGMAAIGRQIGRPTILIPTADVAAILVAEHADALRQWFLFPEQPRLLPRTVANKHELYLLCQRLGVPCPKTAFPNSLDDVDRFVTRATFPVVVKAAESWELPDGGRPTTIAQTPEELQALYRTTENRCRPNLMLQEYIGPDVGEDWFYHGYRNARLEVLRRLHRPQATVLSPVRRADDAGEIAGERTAPAAGLKPPGGALLRRYFGPRSASRQARRPVQAARL